MESAQALTRKGIPGNNPSRLSESLYFPKGTSTLDVLLESFHACHLNEDYNVVSGFEKFVRHMLLDISSFDDEYRYTGWNFRDGECVEISDETVPYPVYVRVIDEPDYANTMSVADRVPGLESEDKILLTMNLAHMKGESKMNLKAILFHECRHCLEMYVTFFNTIKDTPVTIDDEPIFRSCRNPNVAYACRHLISLFLPSEKCARIDGAVHFLKQGRKKWTTKDMSFLISERTAGHTLIHQMEYMIDDMRQNIAFNNLQYPLIVGYLYDRHGCGNGNFRITEEMISEADDIDDEGRFDEIAEIAEKVLRTLENDLKCFINDIMSAIFVHMIQDGK